MCAFFQSQPIFVLENPFENQLEVTLCLHEPLSGELKPKFNPFRHLLSLLSQLSIIIVKESNVPIQTGPTQSSPFVSNQPPSSPITANTKNLAPYTPVSVLKTRALPPLTPLPKVNPNTHQHSNNTKLSDELVSEIFKTVSQISPETTVQQYLVSSGVLESFPDLARRLGCEVVVTKGSSSFDDYLNQMATLHQIVALCTQLTYNINLHNHMYIAHQIALLYQSVNAAIGQNNRALEPYKKLIEQGFDDVKASIEGQNIPLLNNNQKNWLANLASGIQETVNKLEPDLSQKIQPLLGFIKD
eukprot:TRINITY_DN5644_c0_g2_i1.p1 TRINITY_DN5644_c0_g2~~TRINITY_DN5644_c0_g2_i1.p1  ORF type:complete len:301 (+),score=72.14 TRINITY_DN5644_c0_g2_i1:154-1056(+)